METKEGVNVTEVSLERLKTAVENGEPLIGVHTIATHEFPHLDEAGALTLLTIYGEKRFPGISSGFKLGTVSSYQLRRNYGDDAWYKLLNQGILTSGTGGGPLDDHYDETGNAKKEGSATERVARFLRIENKPELAHLIRYINHEDNNGETSSFTGASGKTGQSARLFMFATQMKTTWRIMREEKKDQDFIQKMKEFMEMIRVQILDQRSFIFETGGVLATMEKVPLKMTPLKGDQIPKLVVIESDSERAVPIIRNNSTPADNIVAILHIKSNGQFYVSCLIKDGRMNHRQMEDVVKAIRARIINWKNQGKKPGERINNSWQETRKGGYHPGTEEIFFFQRGGMIFNGSNTQPDVPGLVGDNRKGFPFNKRGLVLTIMTALEDQWWPEEVSSQCSAGKCPAKESDYRCPVYALGMSRCYNNRRG